MRAPNSKCYVYIVSMTVLIHLMVYIATYIFVINVIWVYQKNYFLILYSVYITVILLLDSCMEATICRKKDSACIRIAIGKMALSPEAEDFLHSPENFCTLLRIPTLVKFSIETMNYI
jgi:hypothetical protein